MIIKWKKMGEDTHGRVVEAVACVIDTDPPRREGFACWVRDYVGSVQYPLAYLIDEGKGEVVVEGKSGKSRIVNQRLETLFV